MKRKRNGRRLISVAPSLSSAFNLQRGSHAYGVQPLGNMFVRNSSSNIRESGLGNLRSLSDEIICDILGLLSAKDLFRLALVSKSFYVFSHQDHLWRSLVLEECKGNFVFKGCWRSTYVAAVRPSSECVQHLPLKVTNFYSDYLFQNWLCASLEVKPEWLARDNIARRQNLTLDDFIRDFEEPNKPVLITDALKGWPALSKWDRSYLLEHAEDVAFSAGPVDLRLENYFKYADLMKEERPLYIFDSKFGEKVPQLAEDYEIPIYFREDLFSILGKERPDYRWLIIGPARSGSSFHVDPNSTSAWNAVLRGKKKWVLYPPEKVPPGVYPSPDGAEVATSVSITEWFMNFYEETRRRKEKPVECICNAGEVVFVPHGWWHLVINLEESVAITQNYVSRQNLLNVLEFLKRPNAKDLVSGTHDRVNLFYKFKAEYDKLYPGSIENLQHKAEQKKMIDRKPFWDMVVDTKNGGFKFGFV